MFNSETPVGCDSAFERVLSNIQVLQDIKSACETPAGFNEKPEDVLGIIQALENAKPAFEAFFCEAPALPLHADIARDGISVALGYYKALASAPETGKHPVHMHVVRPP